MEVYGGYGANIELIRSALHENKQQMSHVSVALSNFQSGLLRVEQEMLPIYKLTEKLRETQKNIDLCVHELRKINQNFIVAQELAPTLMKGSKLDQDEYVKALQKLLDAIAFLENHRTYEGSSKALDQARELLVQARKKCKADFLSAVSILARCSRSNDCGTIQWTKPNKQDLAKTTQLLQCLLSSKLDRADLLQEYGKQRFQLIKMVLQDDQESTGTTASVSPRTASASSAASGLLAFSEMTIKSFQRLLRDLEATIKAEKELADSVFGANEELAHTAFRYATHPLLSSLKSDVEAAVARVNTTTTKNQPADPFELLLLHELLVVRAKDLDQLLQPPLLLRDAKGGNTKPTALEDPWVLTKLLTTIVGDLALSTKQKLFGYQFEMTEHIGVNDRSMTKDGNVHPVSSHMLNFLRQLCEHTKPLKLLLTKDSNVTPCSFMETVVMQLVEALQAKSAQLKGRGDLKQLFLTNNFGYIANAMPHCKSQDENDLEVHLQTEIKPRLEEMRDRAIAQFVAVSYQSFDAILSDPKEKLQYQKNSDLLTLESGRLLKDKFTKFNTLLEDIHKTQQQFIVSEPTIRHQLIQAALEAIVPKYARFYDKYSAIHFSKKNTSKYLKYTPKAVEQELKELFLGEVMTEEKPK